VVLHWAQPARRTALPGLWRRISHSEGHAISALMTLYLLISAALTLLAGKAGADLNYFLEFLFLCCIWVGALAARQLTALSTPSADPVWQRGVLALILPVMLWAQIQPAPANFAGYGQSMTGPVVTAEDAALVAAIRASDRPVLCDDLALLLIAGKVVPIDPFVFAELGAAGLWREDALLDMLARQTFGAVITTGDPGGIAFEQRFRPRTAAAILRGYPRVIAYGERRLRLPR